MLLFALACADPPETAQAEPACDGVQSAGEVRVDAPFDADGDGAFDGSDPGCQQTYTARALDCDDADPLRAPGLDEVPCNGVDDDCNVDTADALDGDRDGTIACDDCDDDDPRRHPGAAELCFDGVDNDCDGAVDPGCGVDWSGTFRLDQRVTYQCALELVTIDFEDLAVQWNPPLATLFPFTGGQPGVLQGTIDAQGAFVVEVAVQLGTAAACDEFYRMTGQFDGRDTFEATFEAVYQGGITCLNCDPQLWEGLVGTRTGELK